MGSSPCGLAVKVRIRVRIRVIGSGVMIRDRRASDLAACARAPMCQHKGASN